GPGQAYRDASRRGRGGTSPRRRRGGVHHGPGGPRQRRTVHVAHLYRGGDGFMAKSVEEKVKEIIVEQLGVEEDEVTPNAKFIEDLGADSLDTVELVMDREEHFDIVVPDEDAEKIVMVYGVVECNEHLSYTLRLYGGFITALRW